MTGALAVGRVLHGTVAEGPFLRSAVWVSGCSIRCAGCINPHLFETGADVVDPIVLAGDVVAAGVEGLTLLGGEPFDQARDCAEVAERVRGAGLGVITFTGHSHEALANGSVDERRLLAATDLLVDGPYEHAAPEAARSLVGSTNQRFVHLTDRYLDFDPTVHRNRVDVRIAADGEVRLAGFLTRSEVAHLRSVSEGQTNSAMATKTP